MADAAETAQMQRLREWMGGEGEHIPVPELHALWSEFSADFSASWLVDSDLMRGNFCAWLIGQRTTGLERLITRAEQEVIRNG